MDPSKSVQPGQSYLGVQSAKLNDLEHKGGNVRCCTIHVIYQQRSRVLMRCFLMVIGNDLLFTSSNQAEIKE